MNRLKYGAGHCTVSLSVIFPTVAYSPIVVAGPVHPLVCLPYGFERADINILDWIIAEGAACRPVSFAN